MGHSLRPNVRYWHLADMPSCTAHVCFRGKADIGANQRLRPIECHWPLDAGRKVLGSRPCTRRVLRGAHETARIHHASRRCGDSVFGLAARRTRAAAIGKGLSDRIFGLPTANSLPKRPEAFRAGLRDLGYREGRDFVIEYPGRTATTINFLPC